MNELPGKAYLAVRDFQSNLFDELSINPAKPPARAKIWGDLVYLEGSPVRSYWNRTILEKPFIAEFGSIREAADILRGIQRNWAHHPVACFRRAELIREKLPHVNDKPRSFPYAVPLAPMGMWSLLDEKTLIASAETSSPFPCGEIRFEEDHVNPPSRAYMKMYEALAWVSWLDAKSRINATTIPNGTHTAVPTPPTQDAPILSVPGFAPGTKVVDAGACPGGWTWVFDKLGCTVTAIDRSPLAPSLMAKPNITFLKHDAFTLKPEDLGPQDWVCSDVICYPPRLLEWIREWIDSGLCRNFICTIKMQGKADHETTRAFADIPGSRVVHLTANKNELTWILRGEE